MTYIIEKRVNGEAVEIERFNTEAEADAAWQKNVIPRSDSYLFSVRKPMQTLKQRLAQTSQQIVRDRIAETILQGMNPTAMQRFGDQRINLQFDSKYFVVTVTPVSRIDFVTGYPVKVEEAT